MPLVLSDELGKRTRTTSVAISSFNKKTIHLNVQLEDTKIY